MYLMFKEKYTGPIDVKYVFYHGIFVSKFNLGFGGPKKDVYSCCTKLKDQIRAATERQKKQELAGGTMHTPIFHGRNHPKYADIELQEAARCVRQPTELQDFMNRLVHSHFWVRGIQEGKTWTLRLNQSINRVKMIP